MPFPILLGKAALAAGVALGVGTAVYTHWDEVRATYEALVEDWDEIVAEIEVHIERRRNRNKIPASSGFCESSARRRANFTDPRLSASGVAPNDDVEDHFDDSGLSRADGAENQKETRGEVDLTTNVASPSKSSARASPPPVAMRGRRVFVRHETESDDDLRFGTSQQFEMPRSANSSGVLVDNQMPPAEVGHATAGNAFVQYQASSDAEWTDGVPSLASELTEGSTPAHSEFELL